MNQGGKRRADGQIQRKKRRICSRPSNGSDSPSPPPSQRRCEGRKLPLACPFHKRDPETYHDCRRYELSRVKDVRQHLKRKHRSPLYCSRCYRVFGSAESLENHERSLQSCELRHEPPSGSISKQQWEKVMAQYSGRGKPVEEQWMEIWDTLFPGAQRPPTPYLLDGHREIRSRLLNFWTNNRLAIIAKTMERTFADSHADSWFVFDQFMECFLSQLQAEDMEHTSSNSGTPLTDDARWEDAASTVSTVIATPEDVIPSLWPRCHNLDLGCPETPAWIPQDGSDMYPLAFPELHDAGIRSSMSDYSSTLSDIELVGCTEGMDLGASLRPDSISLLSAW